MKKKKTREHSSQKDHKRRVFKYGVGLASNYKRILWSGEEFLWLAGLCGVLWVLWDERNSRVFRRVEEGS